MEPFLARWAHQLPAEATALAQRLRHTYAEVLAELAAAPATVVHGELHQDNLVFFDGYGVEPPVVVLDWQSVRYGPAAVDVAQVLAGNLPPATRREVEEHLLDRYARRLAAGGVAGYPVDRLRHHYRLALQHQLAGVVSWLAGTPPDRPVGRERALVQAALGDGRLLGALRDHPAA